MFCSDNSDSFNKVSPLIKHYIIVAEKTASSLRLLGAHWITTVEDIKETTLTNRQTV